MSFLVLGWRALAACGKIYGMSNNDFDRAVNFLQGALDVAVSESKAEQGPLLPGFEEPPRDTSREEPQDREENASATAGEADDERQRNKNFIPL